MHIPVFLEVDTPFPDPDFALTEPDGLLAIGGQLDRYRLLDAYHKGIFPWFGADDPVLWWCPSRRAVLFFDDLHIAKSLRKRINKHDLTVTCDTAFAEVIAYCAQPRAKEADTWITADMQAAYIDLHEHGYAHSFEVWQGEELVGGLYGLALGAGFFGESMFNRKPDTSKIAFVYLAKTLQAWGFDFIDCQIINPHLSRMGVKEISRHEFLKHLQEAVAKKIQPPWEITSHLTISCT